MRKVAKVRLTTGYEVISYIGGEGPQPSGTFCCFNSRWSSKRLTGCSLSYGSWKLDTAGVNDRNNQDPNTVLSALKKLNFKRLKLCQEEEKYRKEKYYQTQSLEAKRFQICECINDQW